MKVNSVFFWVCDVKRVSIKSPKLRKSNIWAITFSSGFTCGKIIIYFFLNSRCIIFFPSILFLSLFLSWKKKTLCVAFLHLIYQLLNYYPAISPQWSPIIHPASLLQPQGQNAYENHYENNLSLCLRNVAYILILFLLCGCVCAVFCWGQCGERRIAWRTLDKMFLFLFFFHVFFIIERQWSVPIEAARWELDGERLRLPGHNVLSLSRCLWL